MTRPIIKKAVIPVAGIGSRFLPITKVIPKEMLTIGEKPVIQYLVEEAVDSGVSEIIFVLSPEKEMIRHYFSDDLDLECLLKARDKEELIKKIKPLSKLAHFHYVYQHTPKGDGDALLHAEGWVDGEPFLVLFGDDLVKHTTPAARQLMNHFSGKSIIAVTEIKPEESRQYGMIEPRKQGETGANLDSRLHCIQRLVEKPAPQDAPSNLGIIGKYICPPSIFDALKRAPLGSDGELRLIDALQELQKTESLWALKIEGERFDTGRPEGLLKANIAFSLNKKQK